MSQEQSILPKGIVQNRNAVYDEIAENDVIPEEQILKMCQGSLQPTSICCFATGSI